VIYLSGALNRNQMGKRPDVGIMLGYREGSIAHGWRRLAGIHWAADNGCFTNPNLDVDKYLAWLEKLKAVQGTCLFATAPDVVADAAKTWERSRDVLPKIRALGYDAAFVAQDGQEDRALDWDRFDCLFIGGSTDWKLSQHAFWLCREAARRGKWVHMGRVNSFRRLLRARFARCNSADGTQLAFGPDQGFKKLCEWLDFIQRQPTLDF